RAGTPRAHSTADSLAPARSHAARPHEARASRPNQTISSLISCDLPGGRRTGRPSVASYQVQTKRDCFGRRGALRTLRHRSFHAALCRWFRVPGATPARAWTRVSFASVGREAGPALPPPGAVRAGRAQVRGVLPRAAEVPLHALSRDRRAAGRDRRAGRRGEVRVGRVQADEERRCRAVDLDQAVVREVRLLAEVAAVLRVEVGPVLDEG